MDIKVEAGSQLYTQAGWKFRKLGMEALHRRAVARDRRLSPHTGCGIPAMRTPQLSCLRAVSTAKLLCDGQEFRYKASYTVRALLQVKIAR